MFDLNQIISAALQQAIAEAIKPLDARIEALEMQLAEAQLAAQQPRIAPEDNPATGIDYEEVRRIAREMTQEVVSVEVERAMDEHLENYDHDNYDNVVNEWGDKEAGDFLTDDDVEYQIEEKVKEALNNAHFTISI